VPRFEWKLTANYGVSPAGPKAKKTNSKPEEFDTLAEWQAWRDTQRAEQAKFTPLPKDFTF